MRAFLIGASLGLVAVFAWAADPAEYAIRWTPKQGGPGDAKQALAALKIADATGPKTYKVRYFSVKVPPGGPKDATAIARERIQHEKVETIWKYRWSEAPSPTILDTLKCPLQGHTKTKTEVDVSMLQGNEVRRALSWSCEAKAAAKLAIPASARPATKGCVGQMLRWQSDTADLKLEHWRLPDGQTLMELSWNGQDQEQDRQHFHKTFVAPLLAAGIHPLERTMTEVVTSCTS